MLREAGCGRGGGRQDVCPRGRPPGPGARNRRRSMRASLPAAQSHVQGPLPEPLTTCFSGETEISSAGGLRSRHTLGCLPGQPSPGLPALCSCPLRPPGGHAAHPGEPCGALMHSLTTWGLRSRFSLVCFLMEGTDLGADGGARSCYGSYSCLLPSPLLPVCEE